MFSYQYAQAGVGPEAQMGGDKAGIWKRGDSVRAGEGKKARVEYSCRQILAPDTA